MHALELIALQCEALFRSDAVGRLRSINEPGDQLAPRFFLGSTPAGVLCRFRFDLPDALVRELTKLCQPPVQHEAIRAALAAHGPIAWEHRGPAFWAAHPLPPAPNTLLITDTNADALGRWFPRLQAELEARQPIAAWIEDGDAVAVCYCARRTQRVAEAGLETAEPFRRRGYAAAVVQRWVAEVQAQGRLALYSATWENVASRSLAAKLGFVCYGEDWSVA